ncbi:energy-coupling factor ABC transporter ATP-binding protein [Rhizobium sp. SSA_523]|uniref:energy-coupling factor ABC transporter ATP-binding protein n=1 Tax=Rhizobium sp. SSA_523 TaxID=2952477 RepID=UPI002091207D|nr:ABC transporter ATP-binding protein [Rhizobium sp. SSA_523]MCO5731072.1 energy-coupling factor ABC transporter ATP-binding protein [Rhizobium sp. SSA_523]WKC24127.1 ABC transporter ATP-binding protein [Rhizobium sp. SSA_523]
MHIVFDRAELRYGERVALHPLSLDLCESRIGVIGLNGSGKTSFARLVNGLAKPSSGRVTLDGLDTVDDAQAVMAATGFIFQNPGHQIILPIIRDDIALGPKSRGLSKEAVTAAVDAVLARFDIAALADRRPHELSGGQLQLAALAAVVVTQPKLILFDEPTNQLDLKNRALVKATLEGLEEQAIVISHDLDLVQGFARVLVFHEGALAFDGHGAAAVQRYAEIAAC